MEWLYLQLRILRSIEYIGSSPAERGTWLSVSGYCADQENGGRLAGAATWKDRQWEQCCGVTLAEVRASHRLLKIDGADVVVFGYPVEKEDEVRRSREGAKAGAKKRWGGKIPPHMPRASAPPYAPGICPGENDPHMPRASAPPYAPGICPGENDPHMPQAYAEKSREEKSREENMGESTLPAPARDEVLFDTTIPTTAEIEAYAETLCYRIDGQAFLDHYAAAGWRHKGHPIADWRALVRTWKRREEERGHQPRHASRGYDANDGIMRVLAEHKRKVEGGGK